MKNQRKKILAIVLLVLVVILGGVSIFVATRISTQTAVAPTAPESQPQAANVSAECGACGGNARISYTCPAEMVCDRSHLDPGAMDLPGRCVKKDATGKITSKCDSWVGAASCKITATINAPPCTPRPACLDNVPTPCTPPEPAGGYCPYLSCNKIKKIYKDVASNTPGSYDLTTANEVTATSTGSAVLYPGDTYVYSVTYSTLGLTGTSPITGARITDTLDSRLEYVDGTSGCTLSTNNVVTCNLAQAVANTSSTVAFRVKVKDTASLSKLTNKAEIVTLGASNATIGNAICYNNAELNKKPEIKLACKRKTALNEAGTSIISSVGKDQTFQYTFDLANDGDKIAPDVVLTDVLPTSLIFVDSASGCTYAESTRTITCKTSLNPGETKKVSIKVKTTGSVADGDTISNKGICKLESSAADVAGSECVRDLTVALPFITAVKEAYLDNSNNQAGVYQLTDAINTVSKNQTFVYAIEMENSGTGTASSVTIQDPLTGENQDQLTLVDRDPKCDWSTADRMMTCHIDIQPGGTGRVAFRVKVSDGISNGVVIKNTAKVLSQGQELTVNKDLNVSSVVSCNHVCTTDAECDSGYACDSTSKKCRNTSCLSVESCVCPVAVTEAPPRVVATSTPIPTAVTEAPVVTQPPVIPEAGILDIPGVAAFGGGLLLAVIGLLLAL